MADLSFEQAFTALKRGDVQPVYYLTGPEELLKDELVAAIVGRVLDATTRDFNLDVRAAGDIDGEALHALVETPPMLAERRVVVVRGIDQWRKNARVREVLTRYLDQPSPTTVLILTQGGDGQPDPSVTRSATHVPVTGLKPQQVARWLARRATAAGVTLDADAAEHLLAAVGGDLSHLALEVEKLAVAAVGTERVTTADVARLVGVRRGETVHDWVDAALGRDTPRALSLVDLVLSQAGVTGVQLVMVLGTALIGVRLARAEADAGTPWGRLPGRLFQRLRAARPPRLRDWKLEAETWAGAARHWSAAELDRAIAAAANADRRLKSTTIADERGILLELLLDLPRPRAAA
ncbi:MAG: DNA polymerase III subunit delta [Gemmatimonadota bacterium]|nr:DNA polymerase III subunit delta [Gemmatimonadota bacterium]